MKRFLAVTLVVVFTLMTMLQVTTIASTNVTWVPKDSDTTVTAVTNGFKISGSGEGAHTTAMLNAKVKIDGLSYKLDVTNLVGKAGWVSLALTNKPEYAFEEVSADFDGIAFLYTPGPKDDHSWNMIHTVNPLAHAGNTLGRFGGDAETKIYNTIKKDSNGKHYFYINKAQDKVAPDVNGWHESFANNIEAISKIDLAKIFPKGEAYLQIRIYSTSSGKYDVTVTDLIGAMENEIFVVDEKAEESTKVVEAATETTTETPAVEEKTVETKTETPTAEPAPVEKTETKAEPVAEKVEEKKTEVVTTEAQNTSTESSEPKAEADVTAPAPGDAGKLTVSNIKTDSVTVQWKKASDNVTAEKALQYCVYYSKADNVTKLADIKANGKAVGSFAADINSVNVKGLETDTKYWFAVIVKDEAGNEAVYNTVGAKTKAPAPHWITSSNAVVSNISGGFKVAGKGKELTAAVYSEKVKIDGLSYKLDLSKAKGKVDWVGLVLSSKPEFFTDASVSSDCKGIALLYVPGIPEDHTWIMAHHMNPIKHVGNLLSRYADDPETRVFNTIKKDEKGKHYLYAGKDQIKVAPNADYGWLADFANNIETIFKVEDLSTLFPDGTAYLSIVTRGRKDEEPYEVTLTDLKGVVARKAEADTYESAGGSSTGASSTTGSTKSTSNPKTGDNGVIVLVSIAAAAAVVLVSAKKFRKTSVN